MNESRPKASGRVVFDGGAFINDHGVENGRSCAQLAASTCGRGLGIGVKRRHVVSAVILCAACGVLAGFWHFWTPRCNEACAPALLAAIYVGLIAFAVLTVRMAAKTFAATMKPARAITFFLLLAATLAAVPLLMNRLIPG